MAEPTVTTRYGNDRLVGIAVVLLSLFGAGCGVLTAAGVGALAGLLLVGGGGAPGAVLGLGALAFGAMVFVISAVQVAIGVGIVRGSRAAFGLGLVWFALTTLLYLLLGAWVPVVVTALVAVYCWLRLNRSIGPARDARA